MESLVEGVFGRAFKRQIHPVEIAKGLTREMDDNRMVSVSRTYAPNDFTVHLSPQDAEAIEPYKESLKEELIQYVSAHARNHSYHMVGPPRVEFVTEDSLNLGEFGVTARLTGSDDRRRREEGAPEDTSGETRIFKTAVIEQGTAAISAEDVRQHGLVREIAELEVEGRKYPLEGQGPWIIGRSEKNDIVISDPNVSRRHARLSRSGDGFVIEDLDSTNGTLLDGAPIKRERIEDGDELTFGQSRARFIRRAVGPGED
ncbi:DUF2662 domain-containing protein [Rubrobacter taiwanensis]|jgi:hypothetical protein|uniref:DUF2662 domain-containing protein n=2 Tax=Rubrobacter taiwanensis TaxID=185139 RepID=A0A4R1BFJ2_9ACTN|nr:DUF2662 domain-containing protein [Rubrobacter taiwanensis]